MIYKRLKQLPCIHRPIRVSSCIQAPCDPFIFHSIYFISIQKYFSIVIKMNFFFSYQAKKRGYRCECIIKKRLLWRSNRDMTRSCAICSALKKDKFRYRAIFNQISSVSSYVLGIRNKRGRVLIVPPAMPCLVNYQIIFQIF